MQLDHKVAPILAADANSIRQKGIFATIFLALYILCFYIPNGTFPELLASAVLYIFIGITFLKIIIRQVPLKVTQHSVWLLSFGILGFSSSLYAIDIQHVLNDLYVLFVTWIVAFSFVQYVQRDADFKRLFSFYAYFPLFLAFYLLLNRTALVQGERLGETLFGNANRIATYLMVSLFCILWLIVYAKGKRLFINILGALILFYMTVLTGGRKYIIVPLIFFLLLMVFKNWRENKGGLILYLVLFMATILFGTWGIINIPTLYNAVGVRFVGLINFLNAGLVGADASTMVRYLMIENGWNWFLQRPVLGYGLNNFAYLFSQVLYDVYAHNNYIEILVDLGVAGFLLYYSFYVYIIVKLISIKNDVTGTRNFFLAFMIVLLIFELGGVTYQYAPIQIFIGLASAFIWLYEKGKISVELKKQYRGIPVCWMKNLS